MDTTDRRAGAAGALLFAELASAGFAVERIGELRRFPDYRAAIPVLLRWLPRVEDDHLKWAIVCALGVRWAKPAAAPALVAEFRRAPEHPRGYKWAVGAALACVADEGAWEDMVALVCDPSHGYARQMLVAAVGRMRRPRADDVLIALLSDGDAEIVEQAALALGRRKATRASGHLAALRAHEDRRVRASAVRALAMIERARERLDSCADGLASREAPLGDDKILSFRARPDRAVVG